MIAMMMTMRKVLVFWDRAPGRATPALLLAGILFRATGACGNDSTAPDPELEGGVLATFNVEGELTYWLNLGRYCPWSAVLVKLEDYR